MYISQWECQLYTCIHTIICFSVTLSGEDGDLLFDYSKNIITDQTLALLFKLVSKFLCCVKYMSAKHTLYHSRRVLKELRY